MGARRRLSASARAAAVRLGVVRARRAALPQAPELAKARQAIDAGIQHAEAHLIQATNAREARKSDILHVAKADAVLAVLEDQLLILGWVPPAPEGTPE